jgi:DNA-binding NarL/FixJ family response regulator
MIKTSTGISPLPKKVYIVEDHPVFCEGLTQLVNAEQDLTVCGHAGDADQALRAISRLKPDLVVVDITLPGKSGLELIKELRPKNRHVKLLVLSMHNEALYANRVLRAGGDGYIMKQEDPEEIVHAIRDVLGGHTYVSEQVLVHKSTRATVSRESRIEAKTRPLEKLTDAEVEILAFLGQGKSNKEIARQLRLDAAIVVRHCARIQKKLKLKSLNALIRYAVCWAETSPL